MTHVDIIYSGECMSVKKDVKMPTQGMYDVCDLLARLMNNKNPQDFIFVHSLNRVILICFYVINSSGLCTKCGYISSQTLCKACVMLEGLNRGLPKWVYYLLFVFWRSNYVEVVSLIWLKIHFAFLVGSKSNLFHVFIVSHAPGKGYTNDKRDILSHTQRN